MTDDHDTLQHRAERLGLYGLLDHWGEISDSALIAELLGWEENERHRRSLERRIRNARIGSFKPLTDFEWDWPEQIDREQIRDLLNMEWPDEAMNVILVGPNGVGKSMLAKNLGYQRGDFPVAEAICESVISLPVHEFIGETQLDAMAAAIRAFYG